MAEEAEEAALASAARPRRRASIAQTPAAAAPVGGAAVPRTAASTRGVRRRSVLPAADAAPHQVARLPRCSGRFVRESPPAWNPAIEPPSPGPSRAAAADLCSDVDANGWLAGLSRHLF